MSRYRNIRRAPVAVALASAIAAGALAATPAVAQVAAPAAHTISVTGSAQVEPKPFDKKSNASIKKAVAAANAKAIPLAISNGRTRAATLSQLSGLPLGELVSIAEASFTPPFYFSGPLNQDGSFGPGEYCGTVRRAIVHRDANGRRKVVGTRSSRVCRVPRYVTSNLVMVFATT
jgi:hypothetical protein